MMSRKNHASRSALTLVELLVVITIMVLLLGVVLPLAGPALRGREVREAARQVSAFLASAQADAIAKGTPVGVALIPDPNDASRCIELAKVRIPPPYSDPKLRLRFSSITGIQGVVELVKADGSPIAPIDWAVMKAIVPEGSRFLLKLDFRGRTYLGMRQSNDFFGPNAPAVFTVSLPNGIPQKAGPGDPGLPFSIERPPRRMAGGSMKLPVGGYVDLASSGFASTMPYTSNFSVAPGFLPSLFEGSFYHDLGYLPVNAGKLVAAHIMFDSAGQLAPFWGEIVFPGTPADNAANRLPTQSILRPDNPIHILLSGAKRSPSLSSMSPDLLVTLSAQETGIWVTVKPSGKITTVPNLGYDAVQVANAMPSHPFLYALYQARNNTRGSGDMGGQ